MAVMQQKPPNPLASLFGTPPDPFDPANAPPGGVDGPQGPGAPNLGPIPHNFDAYAADPNNHAKLPSLDNNRPMPTMPQPPMAKGDFLSQNPVALPNRPNVPHGRGFIGMALATLADNIGASLSGRQATVGPNWMQRVGEAREYDQNLPAVRSEAETKAYDLYLQERNTTSEIGARDVNTANQQLINPFYQKGAELRDELAGLWQKGDLSDQDFDKVVNVKLAGNPYARLITPSVISQIKGLPQQPPAFAVKDGAIQPIRYRGADYGALPGQNEPPEIGKARGVASGTLQQEFSSKFGPEVIAQLGQPPVGNPAGMADYGKKAEAIKTRMASDPRIAAALSRPVQVVMPGGNVGYQGAGQAIKSGATAPGSIPFQVQKNTLEYFTTGPGGNELTAFRTAIAHADLLDQAAKALNNGDQRTFADLKNRLETEFGDKKLTDYNTIAGAYTREVTKALSAGHITDSEISSSGATLPSNANYETQHSVFEKYKALMASKAQQRMIQYEQAMQGKPAFPDGMTPSTAAVEEYVRDPKTKKLVLKKP